MRLALVEVVRLEGDPDAGAVDDGVQLAELVLGAAEGGAHVALARHVDGGEQDVLGAEVLCYLEIKYSSCDRNHHVMAS